MPRLWKSLDELTTDLDELRSSFDYQGCYIMDLKDEYSKYERARKYLSRNKDMLAIQMAM